ncbi:MAG: 50S ribosomal protein L6 [Coxiella sp. RIFCSPHIGHO2_12_FULL_42_15]|nr:MAG: 50S ribosomal protein L6 [Coxiella sp. RIFCSPHIGHO2_12_FULL_42_15]
MVSRVAKNPIEVPKGVDIKISDNRITVKGKNGELKQNLPRLIAMTHQDSKITVRPVDDEIKSNALAGTLRALVQNMVRGVTDGFERKLVLVGVGYRAKAQGKKLNLAVGFSHPVDLEMPEGITVDTPSQTEIILKGADKQALCQMAANIRAIRPPEPYKGKGIRYADETIRLKEAKKK